jgi:hypothetical protein
MEAVNKSTSQEEEEQTPARPHGFSFDQNTSLRISPRAIAWFFNEAGFLKG